MNIDGQIKIKKCLSRNDTGQTGSHQVGILIPKSQPEIMDFFPPLDSAIKNPDQLLRFQDSEGLSREFRYIYYNGQYFHNEDGKPGTRNEYRLTRMTGFIKDYNLRAGDSIIFQRTVIDWPNLSPDEIDELNYPDKYGLSVEVEKRDNGDGDGEEGGDDSGPLELSGKWVKVPC
jgi:hypothetical protein